MVSGCWNLWTRSPALATVGLEFRIIVLRVYGLGFAASRFGATGGNEEWMHSSIGHVEASQTSTCSFGARLNGSTLIMNSVAKSLTLFQPIDNPLRRSFRNPKKPIPKALLES